MGVPLNVDVAASISALKDALKDFELRLKLYRILFQGKALDFEGYRTYTQGDDASLIDWRSTMRANKLLVKQYKEEQDIQIMFAVDVGEHMLSGTGNKLKAEYTAEAVAALAHLILDSGDKIGLVTYSNRVKSVIMPKRGMKHFELLVETLSDSANYGGSSDIGKMLQFLMDYLGPNVKAVIIVSDFLSMKKESVKKMQVIGARFETLAMMIKDPIDRALPDISGEVIFEDPVSGEQLLINPAIAGQAYKQHALIQEKAAIQVFKSSGVDIINLQTDLSFAPELAAFIKERVRQRKFF
jgi:uncharacterized protein (DUF58 family)